MYITIYYQSKIVSYSMGNITKLHSLIHASNMHHTTKVRQLNYNIELLCTPIFCLQFYALFSAAFTIICYLVFVFAFFLHFQLSLPCVFACIISMFALCLYFIFVCICAILVSVFALC